VHVTLCYLFEVDEAREQVTLNIDGSISGREPAVDLRAGLNGWNGLSSASSSSPDGGRY